MKFLLGFCLVAVAVADEMLRCPGATEEKIAEMKKLLVTEDIHDKLSGDFEQLWGPKQIFDADEKTCVKMSWHKVDDKHIDQSMHVKGAWFKEEQTRNSTLEKEDNGVYVVKKDGEPKAKLLTLYATENVIGQFICWLQAPPADSNMAKLKGVAAVAVRADHIKTPLDADIQAQVDEVVHKMQEHKDMLGEIAHFTHQDC